MPIFRSSQPRYTDDSNNDLGTFIKGITDIIQNAQKKKESQKYLDAIQGEVTAGRMRQDLEADANGNVKRIFRSVDPLKSALDKSTIAKNKAQADQFGRKKGFTSGQGAVKTRLEAAAKAYSKMIQSAVKQNPDEAANIYGPLSKNSQIINHMASLGLNYDDIVNDLQSQATQGMPNETPEPESAGEATQSLATRQRAIEMLTKNKKPVTEKNIQTITDYLQNNPE